MKRFLLILLTITSSINLYAQKADTTAFQEKIFTDRVEIMPEFKGGMSRFYARLEDINYTFLDRANKREGTTIVLLVIEKDGDISNVKVLHGLSQEEDNEIIRVVKRLRKWKPGLQGGKPVRVQYAVPINFQLAKE